MQHRAFVGDDILLKFIMMREVLKRSHFDEEEKNVERLSMIKYC